MSLEQTYVTSIQPSETDGLLGFLEDQRRALRSALHGITDEQARLRPVPNSTLSLGGLLKHMVAVERSWIRTDVLGGPADERQREREFTLLPDESVRRWLDAWDVEAANTARVIGDVDLDEPLRNPDSPPFNVRWVLVHLIEETARHAGHADLIREAIDGARADDLRIAAYGGVNDDDR